MNTKGIVIAGAAVGAAVPLILREYVDKPTARAGFDWKKPSALVGIIGGAAATIAGMFGERYVGSTIATLLAAAGPAMLVTGVYSALFPKATTAARAFSSTPSYTPALGTGTIRIAPTAPVASEAKIY